MVSARHSSSENLCNEFPVTEIVLNKAGTSPRCAVIEKVGNADN